MQTTWTEHGIVRGRETLLFRSAEIQPLLPRFSDWTFLNRKPQSPPPTQHNSLDGISSRAASPGTWGGRGTGRRAARERKAPKRRIQLNRKRYGQGKEPCSPCLTTAIPHSKRLAPQPFRAAGHRRAAGLADRAPLRIDWRPPPFPAAAGQSLPSSRLSAPPLAPLAPEIGRAHV